MIKFNKNINVLLSVIVLASLVFSCSKEEVFTGSPVDSNVEFVNLQASITTPETEVMANQVFPVTISLGSVTFPMDVSVEAIAFLPNLNKRARKNFIIPAGTSTLTSEMVAPSGDALGTDMPFDFDLKLYLSAITTAPEVIPKGFSGKQYKIVCDTLFLGYGDTTIPGLNTKRLAIRFDFEGPYNGNTGGFNNLNIVFKKNNGSSAFPVATQTTRPIYGTTKSLDRYESINFLDEAKVSYKIFNATVSDSINKIFTVKFGSQVTATSFNHGFKVGDEVKLENFSNDSSLPYVIGQVTQVIDYSSFKCTVPTNLFGSSLSFYQPKIVNTNQTWSPFNSYLPNEALQYNGVTYYCKRIINVNPIGNIFPNVDTDNWTTVKPKLVWNDPLTSAPSWVAGTPDNAATPNVDESVTQYYNVNDVYKYNNVVYVCIKQYSTTSSTPNPTTAGYFQPVINSYTSDFSTYTSTDEFTIDAFAQSLLMSPANLKYRISMRYPNGTYQLYKGVFSNLIVGNESTAVPKLKIVKTTVAGVSTYQVNHFE